MRAKFLPAFLFVFLILTPLNVLAISYTHYEIFSYTGGWGLPVEPTSVFSGYAIVRDDPEITHHYAPVEKVRDTFHTFEIHYFEMIFTDRELTHSGDGFVRLGRLSDIHFEDFYQPEDSYRIGDYYAAMGYGPVDIVPHKLHHRLPDQFGLWRPETNNPALPDLFGQGIRFTNPTPIPEPSTLALLGAGISVLLIARTRNTRRRTNAR